MPKKIDSKPASKPALAPPVDALYVKRLTVESLELVDGEGKTRGRFFTRDGGKRVVFSLEGPGGRSIQMVGDQGTGELAFRILDRKDDFYPVSLGFTDIEHPEKPALDIGEPYDDERGHLQLALLEEDFARPYIQMREASGAWASLQVTTAGKIDVSGEAADEEEEEEMEEADD